MFDDEEDIVGPPIIGPTTKEATMSTPSVEQKIEDEVRNMDVGTIYAQLRGLVPRRREDGIPAPIEVLWDMMDRDDGHEEVESAARGYYYLMELTNECGKQSGSRWGRHFRRIRGLPMIVPIPKDPLLVRARDWFTGRGRDGLIRTVTTVMDMGSDLTAGMITQYGKDGGKNVGAFIRAKSEFTTEYMRAAVEVRTPQFVELVDEYRIAKIRKISDKVEYNTALDTVHGILPDVNQVNDGALLNMGEDASSDESNMTPNIDGGGSRRTLLPLA